LSVGSFLRPSLFPDILKDLTKQEWAMLARICPLTSMYYKDTELYYSSHLISFLQDVSKLRPALVLPRLPNELNIIIFSREVGENAFTRFRVNAELLERGLRYLIQHNHAYHDLNIVDCEGRLNHFRENPTFDIPHLPHPVTSNSAPTVDDNNDPTVDGNNDPTVDGNNDPTVDGNNDPTVDGNNYPTVDGNNDPTVDDNNDPTVDGNNDPTVDGNNDPTVDGNNDPTVDGNNDPTVDGNNDPTVDGNNDPTVDDNNDPTVDNNYDPNAPMISNNESIHYDMMILEYNVDDDDPFAYPQSSSSSTSSPLMMDQDDVEYDDFNTFPNKRQRLNRFSDVEESIECEDNTELERITSPFEILGEIMHTTFIDSLNVPSSSQTHTPPPVSNLTTLPSSPIPTLPSSSSHPLTSSTSPSTSSNNLDPNDSSWIDEPSEVSSIVVPDVQSDSTHQALRELLEHEMEAPPLSSPLNDLRTIVDYFCQSFPELFPDGHGDITSSQNLDNQIKYLDWLTYLLLFKDKRFQRHKTFAFVAWEIWFKKRVSLAGNLYLKNHMDEEHFHSIMEQVGMLDNEDGLRKVSGTMSAYLSPIPSTPSFWHLHVKKMQAAIDYLDRLPTFFYTFSFADLHDFFLHKILETPSKSQRFRSVKDNIVEEMQYLHRRWNTFRDEVFFPLFRCFHFIERWEFQSRGFDHILSSSYESL